MVQEDDHIHEAGSAESEKECDDYLQLEINRKPEIAWSERASKPEELLKLLAAQPPLLKPAHNAPNAYTTSAETGSTIKAVANTTHNSEESLNLNLVEGAAPKKAEMSAGSEAAKEEGWEPQQVEGGNVYEARSIKESVIADPEHKVLSKSSCPQFARKKPDHILLADSRKLGLKQTSPAARRLRLPEGPKGEPPPSRSRRPCCQPEMLGECGHSWKHLTPARRGARKQNRY
uniref:Uncharacterized protein n=1 Tax=Ananas comosus var. bracteatus TaxID=296719 RepID=A0A6V7PLJ4_ANACO|nr:unnamed protein product [Ananas comosus var. bracteatus]